MANGEKKVRGSTERAASDEAVSTCVGDVMEMSGLRRCGSRWKLVCVSSGEVRLVVWELAVGKAGVGVATASIGRTGVWLCKAAAAGGSESRGLRSTNHAQNATVHDCPMSVRWSCVCAPLGEKDAAFLAGLGLQQ